MTPKALSREIKFRAFDKDIKEMFYFGMYGAKEFYIREHTPYSEFEVMQYTGLHDKNGKEIYEGDFVMFVTTRLEVIWDENRVGFSTLDINRKDMGGMQNKKGRFGEIIGNIYESPELLTKENN